MRLQQAVHDFIAALELTESEREAASAQHTYLREGLAARLDLDPDYNAFLTGSYARSTAIRPLKDIDVFCVLKRTQEVDPTVVNPMAALTILKEALDTQYDGKAAEPQNRSVNIAFSKTKIAYDVVPAFVDEDAADEIFLIPDIRANDWISSNPRVHKQLSIDANAATGSELKPLTKAVKHWNRQLPEEERLRSFHIEVMAWEVLLAHPETRLDGLVTLFGGLARRVLSPTRDPANLRRDIDEGLTAQQRNVAAQRLQSAATTLADAMKLAADGKTEAAHHLLYGLFGDPYPVKGKAETAPASSSAPITVPSAPDGQGSRFG